MHCETFPGRLGFWERGSGRSGAKCQEEAVWAELEWSAILLGPILAVSVGIGIWALSWLYDRVANAIRRWQDSWGPLGPPNQK